MRNGRYDHGQLGLNRIASPGDAGQECGKTKTKLRDYQRDHEDCRSANGFDLRIGRQRPDSSPSQYERNNNGMHNMRPPAHAVMAEHGSKKELDIKDEDRQQRQGEEAGAALIEFDARLLLNPFLASEYSHRDGKAEECLCQRGVGRRDWRGQEEKYRESAEYSLSNDCTYSANGEEAQPAALLGAPRPDGQDDRQKARTLRDHAMGVFELHSTHKFWDLVPGSKRSRPVGNGEASIIAADESSGDDEKKSPAGENYGEAVKTAIVCCSDGFQSRAP